MNVNRRRSRVMGVTLLAISIIAFTVYVYFLLGTQYGMIITQLTVLGAISVLLAVLGWIGYTMLTVPKTEQEDGRT